MRLMRRPTERPFSVGDRVRFNGLGMDVEGTVKSHGLLFVTCVDGDDEVRVPDNTALTMSVRPIREPAGVDLRARGRRGLRVLGRGLGGTGRLRTGGSSAAAGRVRAAPAGCASPPGRRVARPAPLATRPGSASVAP